jgi:hypothetical protein
MQQQLQQGVAIEELNGPRKRWGHTCNSIKGGRFLYVFGGYGKDNCQTNQVHVFDTGRLSLLLLSFSCFYFSLYILSSLSFSLLQFWGFLWCTYEIWIFCLLGILRIFFLFLGINFVCIKFGDERKCDYWCYFAFPPFFL